MTDAKQAKSWNHKINFTWNIHASIVKCCFDKFTVSDTIFSPIFKDTITNTQWVLRLCPYYWYKETKESKIELHLIQTLGYVNKIKIKNKKIYCKQIKQQLIADKHETDTYQLNEDHSFPSQIHRYKVNDLQKAKELTFDISFIICDIIKDCNITEFANNEGIAQVTTKWQRLFFFCLGALCKNKTAHKVQNVRVFQLL